MRRLRCCSHQLGGSRWGQERTGRMMPRGHHRGVVVLGPKASSVHLVLMMERWIGTKEGVHIAVVEAWNIAVRAATGTTHLVRRRLHMAGVEVVRVVRLGGCGTHH